MMMILSERYNLESSPDVSDVYRGGLQLMLHLQITYDNFDDIFPICLNEIFFFKCTVSALSVVVLFTNLIT